MTIRQYIEQRALSDQALAKLVRAIKDLEARMALAASTTIAGFDTQGSDPRTATVIANAANMQGALDVINAMKAELAGDPWIDAVSDYLESLDDTADRVIEYTQTLGDPDPAVAFALRRQYKVLIADLLTNPSTYNAALWVPAYQSISASVASEAQISQVVTSVNELVKGDSERLGKIENAVGQPVSDAQAVHERATTQALAKQLDIQFYFYQGSEIDTTRDFCAQRRDHAWHVKEIEEWASLDWQGKRPETTKGNIFELLGGYNCRHIAVPISMRNVPASDLARMRAKGLI